MAAPSQDVIKAIPRNTAITQFVVLVLVGTIVVWLNKLLIIPWFRNYLSVTDKVVALHRLQLVMIGVALLMVGVAVWAAFEAKKVLVSGQFPQPGTTVWRDTPITRGRNAQLRGWVMASCALAALACAVYALYVSFAIS